MKTTFDPNKNIANKIKHGVSLSDFQGFDAEPVVLIDDRFDYGETRYRAFGRIDGMAYCLVFAQEKNTMRLISFRRAHIKEINRYE